MLENKVYCALASLIQLSCYKGSEIDRKRVISFEFWVFRWWKSIPQFWKENLLVKLSIFVCPLKVTENIAVLYNSATLVKNQKSQPKNLSSYSMEINILEGNVDTFKQKKIRAQLWKYPFWRGLPELKFTRCQHFLWVLICISI